MTTRNSTSRLACTACSKKVVAHKIAPICTLCLCRYHPKCVDLTPHDVKTLEQLNKLSSWICPHCSINIFPFFGSTEDFRNSVDQNLTDQNHTPICK